MTQATHFTTRRAFIAASGFGGLSLYGLWAAYGAAPTPLALLGLDKPHAGDHADEAVATMEKIPGDAHSAHGGGATGSSSDEFNRMTMEFVERFRLPDGSVHPRRLAMLPVSTAAPVDPHAGHQMPALSDPHAGHEMANMPGQDTQVHSEHGSSSTGHGESANAGSAIDVLMVAGKWYYLPNLLRLDVGQAYRFRMMAMDVAHGASIQFGKGGRMMRLQPGRVSETELTFSRPGRYLMHCTVYCGDAHDMMQATIEVV